MRQSSAGARSMLRILIYRAAYNPSRRSREEINFGSTRQPPHRKTKTQADKQVSYAIMAYYGSIGELSFFVSSGTHSLVFSLGVNDRPLVVIHMEPSIPPRDRVYGTKLVAPV
jgi:hypothetical protein